MRSRVALALAVALASRAHAADNPAAALEAPAVQVIGTTPLPGIGTPIEQVPANVQTLTDRDRARPGVVEVLDSEAASFTVNQPQGNPYQPDVNFRGFAASPLLGTPQGVSYLGSRIASDGGSFGRFGVEAETGGFRGEANQRYQASSPTRAWLLGSIAAYTFY